MVKLCMVIAGVAAVAVSEAFRLAGRSGWTPAPSPT
jgi:hypothetical protein